MTPSTTNRNASPSAGPTAAWLCAGFLLAGMGTVLLGPILPELAARWGMRDADSGLLLLAKFTGAFIGGISVPRKLSHGIAFGLLASCLGLTAFAFALNPYVGAAELFVCGIGLGLIFASTNILAGNRYTAHTGSALALINFFWSLGAVLTGVLAAALLPHHDLPILLLSFASMFLVVLLGGLLQRASTASVGAADLAPGAATTQLSRRTLLLFMLMLFLYGGLETCLSQWLTTYSLRYTTGHILGGQSAIVILWSALTVGRGLSSLILRRIPESALQRAALLGCVVLIPVLANCSTAASLSATCVLLGLCLAPFFPATFALLMRRNPSPRIAGLILAVSGLGAAGLSYIMGLVSTGMHSLRFAMAVPFAAAAGLLAASFAMSRQPNVRQYSQPLDKSA